MRAEEGRPHKSDKDPMHNPWAEAKHLRIELVLSGTQGEPARKRKTNDRRWVSGATTSPLMGQSAPLSLAQSLTPPLALSLSLSLPRRARSGAVAGATPTPIIVAIYFPPAPGNGQARPLGHPRPLTTGFLIANFLGQALRDFLERTQCFRLRDGLRHSWGIRRCGWKMSTGVLRRSVRRVVRSERCRPTAGHTSRRSRSHRRARRSSPTTRRLRSLELLYALLRRRRKAVVQRIKPSKCSVLAVASDSEASTEIMASQLDESRAVSLLRDAPYLGMGPEAGDHQWGASCAQDHPPRSWTCARAFPRRPTPVVM